MKDVKIALIVAVGNMMALVQVGSENVGVLVNRAVLDNRFFALSDLMDLIEPAVEKINLQVERPSGHVVIKIAEIGVMVNRFVEGRPSIVLRKLLDQRGLARTDVARNGYVF